MVFSVGQAYADNHAQAADDSLAVGEIQLQRRNVFSRQEATSGTVLIGTMRRIMNRIHVVTRPGVLKRELLFKSGAPFEVEQLLETERNLRALGFLNDVSVTPTDTTPEGAVNILVNTRDSWTLKTDFAYTQASGGDTRWNLQMSDTNFLGYGVTMGAGLGGDENSNFWHLWYRQRRVRDTALWLGLDESERQDGYVRSAFLKRPFWSQGDHWSLETRVWARDLGRRFYLSNAGRAGLDPGREANLFVLLPRREKGFEGGALLRTHGRNEGRVWRLGLGTRWSETHYDLGDGTQELSDGRTLEMNWLDDPGHPLWRETGSTSWAYFWMQSQGRDWTKKRFIMKYGTIEDLNLAASVDLKVGPELHSLGTTSAGGQNRWRAEGSWVQWVAAGPGLIMIRGDGKVVWGDSRADYHVYSLLTGWMGSCGSESTPWLTRVFSEYGHGASLSGSQALVLGLDRGLRTLEFDGMAGDRLVRFNAEEAKVLPGNLLGMFRYGVGVFYAMGAAWWHDEDRGLADARHELGLGLRFGPTRSANAATGRIDLVWDIQNGGSPVITATTRGYF